MCSWPFSSVDVNVLRKYESLYLIIRTRTMLKFRGAAAEIFDRDYDSIPLFIAKLPCLSVPVPYFPISAWWPGHAWVSMFNAKYYVPYRWSSM